MAQTTFVYITWARFSENHGNLVARKIPVIFLCPSVCSEDYGVINNVLSVVIIRYILASPVPPPPPRLMKQYMNSPENRKVRLCSIAGCVDALKKVSWQTTWLFCESCTCYSIFLLTWAFWIFFSITKFNVVSLSIHPTIQNFTKNLARVKLWRKPPLC